MAFVGAYDLALLLFSFLYITTLISSSEISCDFYIAPSRFLQNGIGIFAGRKHLNKSAQKPGITVTMKQTPEWQLIKYVFAPLKGPKQDDYSIVEFGPAMIYNHHENPTVQHYILDKWTHDKEYMNNIVFPQIKMFQLLEANTVYPLNYFLMLEDIQPGEEMFNSYGPTWFTSKGIVLKTPTKKETSYGSLELLKKVGHCVSNIYTAPSLISSEESTGQGVFASVDFKVGEFVDVSPVLVHPKHEVIETSGEMSVLINFCFSRPGSDVSLLPIGYAAVCNHGGKKLANVAIEWYFWGGNYNESARDRDPEFMIKSDFAELYFGYRALRDIKKDEEILIDYGDDWEADWNKYLQQKHDFVRFQQPVPLFRRAINLPAHMFSDKWYVDCIGASCATMTEDQKKNPTYKRVSKSIEKKEDNSVDVLFTSEFSEPIDLYWSDSYLLQVVKGNPTLLKSFIGHSFTAKRGNEVVGQFTVGENKNEQVFIINSKSSKQLNSDVTTIYDDEYDDDDDEL